MSHSPRHDEGVQAVAAYLAQDRPLAMLIEPGRPRSYPEYWSWDSPDCVSFLTAYKVISADYKCSRSDVMAQLEKPQVKDPRFAVGLFRSLFVDRSVIEEFGGAVPLPDRYGLYAVESDWSITEMLMPERFKERNHGQECHLWEAAYRKLTHGGDSVALRGKPAIQKTRGKRAELEALVKELGSVTFAQARAEIGVGLAEFDRLVSGSFTLKRLKEPGQRDSIVLAETKTTRTV